MLPPEQLAEAIAEAFDSYRAEFIGMTRRARGRFARREWAAAQQDSVERLLLYRKRIDQLVANLLAALGPDGHDPGAHPGLKDHYARIISGRPDAELAETFLNSVARRLFGIVGIDPRVEFTDHRSTPDAGGARASVFHRYPTTGIDAALVERILCDYSFGALFRDRSADTELAARETVSQLRAQGITAPIQAVETVSAVFYRNKGAYLIGRILTGDGIVPLVLPLRNPDGGVTVDAVLTSSTEANVVFGFTHSYFHVDVAQPRAVIDFLHSIMPLKRLDELYTAIGYSRHGKTELYRDLQRHLEDPAARFEVTEGDRGMVMSVFTLPSLNVVFKIIKDRFDHPKSTTRARVMEKYQLVFVRDRVGRLADAQEFEHLQFNRQHFAPELLDDLLKVAASTVSVDGDRVVVRHLYTERRVTPLNLFLRDASEEAARDIILDYGTAIKDLARANIFPGDMLLKNFGVTRNGRVIFYDYDELCLLTECNFRRVPPAQSYEDEMSAEPWFHVGERDVFPEEFRSFVLLPGSLGDTFMAAHRDLMDVTFWQQMQERHQAGELMDFFPYRARRHLRR